jgi:hypothetical protein
LRKAFNLGKREEGEKGEERKRGKEITEERGKGKNERKGEKEKMEREKQKRGGKCEE